MPEFARGAALALVAALLGACTYSGSAGRAASRTSAVTSAGSSSTISSSAAGEPTPVTRSSSEAAKSLRVLNCGGQRAVRSPKLLYLTCGDGTVSVQGIQWSTFGGSVAHGAGTLHRRTCTPNCATGEETTAPAQVTLSDPGGRDGMPLYRRLVVETAGATPQTLRLPG